MLVDNVKCSVGRQGDDFCQFSARISTNQAKSFIGYADLRKPTIHKSFRLNNKYGLTTLLMTTDIDNSTVIQELPQHDLSILPTGP